MSSAPTQTPQPKRWLTTSDIARRFQVSRSLVQRWLTSGLLRGHVIGACAMRRRQWRIEAAEVDRFEAEYFRPADPGDATID